MPDLLSHIGFIYLISLSPGLIKSQNRNEDRLILMIGAIMVDFSRPILYLASLLLDYETINVIGRFTHNPSHSILGVLIVAGLFTSFFHDYDLKRTYFLLAVGGFSHLLLDMTLWPWWGGLYLFFPLQGSMFRFSFHLFWPGDYYITLFFGIPLTIIALIHLYRERKKVQIPQ